MPAIRTATNESSIHPSITSPSSATRPVETLTFPKFTRLLTIANKRLYDLLETDEELHRLVHAIELVDQSNRRLDEIRVRQEQFAHSQFQLALDKGLEQRIKSLVRKERRRKLRPRTSPPSSSSWNSSGSPRPCGRDPSLVQRYVDLDDAWNEQNDAYVAKWQEAVDGWNATEPEQVEVHWGPTEDKLTKENLTIKEGEGTFSDPFIFQSRPLEQRLSSPTPPSYVPHTVKRGEEDSATNPSIPPLGNDDYDPQVALDQWANDGDSTILNLVARANVVAPPVEPLHLILCAVCGSDIHHTPDCSQYICYECEVPQPGHYPVDCPEKSPSIYYDAFDS